MVTVLSSTGEAQRENCQCGATHWIQEHLILLRLYSQHDLEELGQSLLVVILPQFPQPGKGKTVAVKTRQDEKKIGTDPH